jgi:hypothetical protein
LDPDPVESFRIRIRIRIQCLPIRLRRRIRIYFNQAKSKLYFFPENFHIPAKTKQKIENYDNYDAIEKDQAV